MKTLTLCALLTLPTFCFGNELVSTSEKQVLAQGSMVKTVNWKEGFIWPEVKIITLLNHSPLDNLNVFLNFETHKTYIPDMLESRVVKKVSANQMEVYFEMEMPWPVKKATHTTNNVITKNEDGSYTLKWNLVKADRLKATDGYMRFYPYEGKTLLEYVTLIVPNSSLAAMFKDRVASDVEKSVKKITKHLTTTLDKRDAQFSTSQKSETKNNL